MSLSFNVKRYTALKVNPGKGPHHSMLKFAGGFAAGGLQRPLRIQRETADSKLIESA